jgi:hypothetical protein
LSHLQRAHIVSGVYPAYCLMSTGVLCPGVKWSEHEVGQLSPFSAEVENELSYTCKPRICLHGVDKDNFAFLVYEVIVELNSAGCKWKAYEEVLITR